MGQQGPLKFPFQFFFLFPFTNILRNSSNFWIGEISNASGDIVSSREADMNVSWANKVTLRERKYA